jgi:hypothetical protein
VVPAGDPGPFLVAAANAARSRAHDIVRVNAALAAATALILMDDEDAGPARSTAATCLGRGSECVARLERRGRLPLDLAAELRALLEPYGEEVLPRSDEEDAARAYEVAVLTVDLAGRT